MPFDLADARHRLGLQDFGSLGGKLPRYAIYFKMSSMTPREKSLYILKQAALTALCFALMLFAAEGLLRLQKGSARVDDIPYIQVNGLRVFTPNEDTIVTGGAFTPIHVKTNRDGYASPDYPVARTQGSVRIAVMGNSFTRGFEVDYDKKFTSVLEQELKKRDPSRIYEVQNFGIGGYSLVDQLFVYERYVKRYHPDAVLLITHPPTDFGTTRVFLPEAEYLTNTPTDRLSGERLLAVEPAMRGAASSTASAGQPLELWQFARRLFAGVTERLHQLSLRQGRLQPVAAFFYSDWLHVGFATGLSDSEVTKAATVYDETENYFNPLDTERLSLMRFTAGLARKLGDTVRADGTAFALAVIPSYFEIDAKYAKQLSETAPFAPDTHLPTRMFREAVGPAFPVLDLADVLSPEINERHVQIFIRDTGHFTPFGHELVGKTLADFMRTVRGLLSGTH